MLDGIIKSAKAYGLHAPKGLLTGGGTSSRVLGSFRSRMQEKTKALFVDLRDALGRAQIRDIVITKYKRKPTDFDNVEPEGERYIFTNHNAKRSVTAGLLAEDRGGIVPAGKVSDPPNHPIPGVGAVADYRYHLRLPGKRQLLSASLSRRTVGHF